jgi:hypothetical protein
MFYSGTAKERRGKEKETGGHIVSGMFTKNRSDNSDAHGFSFSFFCDLCGTEWRSRLQPFAGGDFDHILNDEAKMLLWADKHRSAAALAELDAQFHFNYCSGCGKWVCNDCFLVEEDKCMDCCHPPP